MWRAAKNNQITWFVITLLFNTFGILPIVYLQFFQKDLNILTSKKEKVSKKVGKKKPKKRSKAPTLA